ncbi:MAG: AMP-binding protein, partial [Chloroflexales bacterium]
MAAISSSPQPHAASAKPHQRVRPRTWQALLRLSLIGGDLLALNGAMIGVYRFFRASIEASGAIIPSDPVAVMRFLLLFNLTALSIFAANGLYEMRRGGSRVDESFKVFTSVALTAVGAIVINTLLPQIGSDDLPVTRDLLVWSWAAALVGCVLMRVLHRATLVQLRAHGIDTRRLLIVGAREPGRLVWNTIRRRPELGYRHANISVVVQQFRAWFPDLKDGEESLMGVYPICHSAGYSVSQNLTIWAGWTNIMIPRPEPAVILEMLKKYRPSFLPGLPTLFVELLNQETFRKMDLSFIKGFFTGVAPLAPDTVKQLQALTGKGICDFYGLTESTAFAICTPWKGKIKPGAV